MASGLRSHPVMYALPPGLVAGGPEQVTGIACPDCPGVLTVAVEGARGYLHFKCRIGHTFSTNELIAAKERQVEDHLWSAVTTLEELTQILRDRERRGIRPERGTSFTDRIERGSAQAGDLRRMLDETEAIDLHPEPGPGERAVPTAGDAGE